MRQFLLFLIIFAYSCSGDDLEKNQPIDSTLQTLIHDGIERQYLLYLPENYDGITKLPLMLNFHGFAGNVKEYMSDTNMRALADIENFILVYPQGLELGGFSHWNPSLEGADNKSDSDDLGFIEALINNLSSQNLIDNKRIYACGFSNGGMMSYGLANHKSNLIAAIGSVSGSMLDSDIIPSHPMPIIKIHGTADEVIPYNGNSDYKSVNSILDFWINHNKTNTNPVLNNFDDNGTLISSYKYMEGINNVSIEHYKVIDGRHVWFDISFNGKSTEKLIWDFVSQYDINGLIE